jgi:hypothetical protein
LWSLWQHVWVLCTMSHEPSKLWDDNGNLKRWEEDYKSWEPCVFTKQAHSRGSWMYPWRVACLQFVTSTTQR